ncbi:hypothetical protein [Stutzerimonas azotifigens]|uniref:hypothetical protein n=1 Tax=Stutzerimonas azotifigens TaxID=291995 RepID=UPI001267DB8C|nr:hypothetical protein [Stutzerimonas azotifigens]
MIEGLGVFRKVFDGALCLALLTGLLFCAGTAKRHGYFLTLSLDSDVLGVESAAVLYSGLIISYVPVFIFALVGCCLVFLYAYVVLPAYVDYARASFVRKRKIARLKKRCFGKRKDSLAEKKAKGLAIRLAGFLVMLLILLFFLAAMEKDGKRQALELLSMIERGEPTDRVMVMIPGWDIGHVLLACGARNCAALNPLTMGVNYFPQDQGFSYVLEPRSQR